MKDFFKKHILIPRERGIMPYFFLMFLIPLFIELFPFNTWDKLLFFVLIFVFVKVYREGYMPDCSQKILFAIQIFIAVLFTLYNGFASLFIYTGWQFPFWPIKKESVRKYYLVYCLTIILSSSYSLIMSANEIQNVEWIWITIGLLFTLSSPIVAYSVEKSERRLYDLRMNNSRLTTLVRQNERERIARDLHDHLGQSYSTISLKAELAQKLLKMDPEKADQELKDIAETSRENLNTVRKIVSNLHEQTIASAMIETADLLETAQIKMETVGEMETSEWPLYIQFAFGSIIQEATTNIVRHSQASMAKYTFKKEHSEYKLTITDNGIGMKTHFKKTHGINGMINRVEDLKGELKVASQSGVSILVSIPEETFEYD